MCDRARRKTDARLFVSNEYLCCQFGCIIEPTGFIMNTHAYICLGAILAKREDDSTEPRMQAVLLPLWRRDTLKLNEKHLLLSAVVRSSTYTSTAVNLN